MTSLLFFLILLQQLCGLAWAKNVTIQATNSGWTNTGISISSGDSLSVNTTGLIRICCGSSPLDIDADGEDVPYQNSFPGPNLPAYSLIAKVGQNGTPFFVGVKYSSVMSETGILYFIVNDSDHWDNTGFFSADVSIQTGPTTIDYKITIKWFDDTSDNQLGNSFGVYRPLKYAKVSLYDDGPLKDDLLATGTLDANGSYTFKNIRSDDSDGVDLYVEIVLDCSVVGFIDYGLATMKTPTTKNVTYSISETFNMDKLEQSTYAYVFNTIQDLHAHWKELTLYDAPKVKVKILAEWLPSWVPWVGAQYETNSVLPSFTELQLHHKDSNGNSDAWNKFTIGHEYGHHIMYQVYGNRWPEGHEGKKHYITYETTLAFALVEGWAEFLQNAFFSDWRNPSLNRTYLRIIPQSYYTKVGQFHSNSNIENNDWWMGPDKDLIEGKYVNVNWNSGAIVEGAVASILWDIFDEDADDDESAGNIQNGISKIWQVMKKWKPNDILEFYDGFTTMYPNDKTKLSAIFSSHGIFRGHNVFIRDVIFPENIKTECIGKESINIAPGTIVKKGANVTFRIEP